MNYQYIGWLLGVAACAACSGTAATPDAGPAPDGGAGDARDSGGDLVTADVPDAAVDAGGDGGACVPSAVPAAVRFTRHALDTTYRSEGVGVLYVNHDPYPDIVTDQVWYEGPGFTVAHEIRAPVTWDPATGYADCFGVYPSDVDHDGYLDIIVAPHHGNDMFWYQNPQGRDVHWTRHLIASAPAAGLENPIVEDLFADGHPVLVMTDSVRQVLGWFTPPADPTQPWTVHFVSQPGFAGSGDMVHGIGVGDVDGRGGADVLTGYGWFEQPPDLTMTWRFHEFSFGPNPRACSRMWTYDVNGDGRADVFCSRPHDYGVHWFEQQGPGAGAEPTFVDHLIDGSISQLHTLRLADLDGDGVPEVITGKRWWAEGSTANPGVNDPALLVYYAMRRCGGAVTFDRHVIDDNSGVGGGFAVADLDGDGRPEVVTANKKGLFWFHHE